MNATKRTPQLRFPEFTGEWQEIKFKDIFCRVTSKNKENNQNILTISAQHGFVSQDKFFSKIVAAKDVQGYYLLHKNDYAYNKSYSKGYPVGAIKRLTQDKGVVSTLYICFSLKKPGGEAFFDQYFESGKHNREIQKIAQEGARNHGLLNISVDDFFDIKLIAPGAVEQQKIAAFLAAVDKRVALLERKMQQLEAYKHGVMQQLFSKQLRFTRPDGSYFPVWQERRLGEITVNKPSTITAGQLSDSFEGYAVYGASGIAGYVKSFQHEQPYTAVVKDGAGAGRLLWCEGETSVLSTLTVLLSRQGIDAGYLHYVLQGIDFSKYITGSTIPHVYYRDFSKAKLKVPTLEEQQKTATFLSALDEKIALIRRQLDKTKQFKKGLLQRMFV